MVAVGRTVEDIAALELFVGELLEYGHVVSHNDDRVLVEVDMPEWIFGQLCVMGAANEDLEDEPIEGDADSEEEPLECDVVINLD